MAGDRDWEKELAKIDKQLGSLSDDALVGPTAVTPPAKGGKPVKASAPATSVAKEGKPPRTWAMYVRLTLSVALAAAIVILALVGAALQDRKKVQLQPDLWRAWESKTSYLPFAAIAAGRARLGGFGLHALLGGLVVWLVATWAHFPLAGWAAGIWRWL